MEFYQYDSVDRLNNSKEEWIIRVRAQTIWMGITRQTGEFRGFNIIFIDDYSSRIHAFIPAQLRGDFEDKLNEGDVYIVEKFRIKNYNGDETSRALRNEKHIYFTSDSKLEKDLKPNLTIPRHSFDFFKLEQLDSLKKDNRFLTDILGVIEDWPTKSVYTKDTGEKSHVSFSISDGRTTIKVTLFNQFGDGFLKEFEQIDEKPVVIIIACGKVSEWKDELYVTNFPATRFYLNLKHSSVKKLMNRYEKPHFYLMDIEEEDDPAEVPLMKVCEIKKLDEKYTQNKVTCQVTLKKFDEKKNWYSPFCIKCEKDLQEVEGVYQCCGRTFQYPDIRFRLYGLCSDESGTIPIVWPDDEISRLLGKTVYDVDAEVTEVVGVNKIPDVLRSFEKKAYHITLALTEANLKEGSNVYNASHISKPLEMSDTHSPSQKEPVVMSEIMISNDDMEKDNQSKQNSPPTEKSTNRTRSRVTVEPLHSEIQPSLKQPKFVNVKMEKK